MTTNNGLSSNQLQILNIFNAIYQNEKFYNSPYQNIDYYGYLIENKIIEKIKKDIDYIKLKPLIGNDRSYDKYKKEIKDIPIEKDKLFPKYLDSKKLYGDLLNNNKTFYLIKQDYLCNDKMFDKDKLKGKEIKFKMQSDIITLIIDENRPLNFTNNRNCLIGRVFIKKDDVTHRETTNDQIKFNKELEILVRIFYYNKYLKEKENDAFIKLNEENKETVYLINNSWMEEYKSFFDYQSLENYLMNKKEFSDLFIKNNYYFSKEKINEIVNGLPEDYINKINKKENFDKNKTLKYEYNQNKNEINYLCNNHIINSKIYQLLLELKYKLKDSLKKFDLYFVGNKKILLLSNEIGGNRDTDEIGFINNDGIFIPEYIFKYKEDNNISLDVLNKFFLKDFINLHLDKDAEIYEIKNEEKNFGECYKLNIKNLESPKKEETNNGILSNKDQNSFVTSELNEKKEKKKKKQKKEKKKKQKKEKKK